MLLQDLKEYIDLVLESNPKAKSMSFLVEPERVWKHYHLSDGCALRGQHGVPDIIVFRVADENVAVE